MTVDSNVVGAGVVTVACAAGTAYVAIGNTIPSMLVVIAGTVLTVMFGMFTIGAMSPKESGKQ